MTSLANQPMTRRPRRPRTDGVRSKRIAHSNDSAVRQTREPLPIKRNSSPSDAELPLLREIANQLQQISNIDPATALRQSRQLLEGAFRAVDNAAEQNIPIAI